MKEVTIPTGPHGGLGNIAIQTDPIKRLLEANESTIRTADNALRDFMKDDYVGHKQRVFRIAQQPATPESLNAALAGENTHITTIDTKYEGSKPVKVVKNGASREELETLVKGGYTRQHDITLQYSVHGAGGETKLVEHPISLFHENWSGGRVKAVVDHLAGAADQSIWERLTKAIEENGGKVLKKIIRV